MVILVDYDGCSEVQIVIDKEVFTNDLVKSCLEFFIWDWDEENDPYTEYAKKIAKQVWALSHCYSFEGIMEWFNDAEGWPPMDGSFGVKLENIEAFEFDDDLICIVTVSTPDEKEAKN